MKISVVLPSRGLLFAQCIQSLLDNIQGYDYRVHISYDLPIPECENVLTEKALSDNPDYVLFVEEDIVIPDGALDDMIMTKSAISCIDYGVEGYSCITRDKKTDEILWCGLGCTLVKTEVFARLDKPYFRSDVQLLLNNYPEEQWISAPKDAYGGQDIYFCMMVRKKGFMITQVGGECAHLKVDALGVKGINKGLHVLSEKPAISKHQTLPL